jgi:hypothetical protein
MKKNEILPLRAGRTTLLLALLTLSLAACRTAEVAVPHDLKAHATAYAVKGRQGFQVGQVLSFGDYSTNRVSRGWTRSYSIPFVVQFNGAREKLSYRQSGPGDRWAEVALVSRFREVDVSPAREYFGLSTFYKNMVAGGIELSGSRESWEFVIYNADGGRTLKNNTAGFVRSRADGTRIDITGIRKLEGNSPLMPLLDIYGYEFRLDGQPVGAVSTVNNGRVWIKDNLHPELKLVLASVSSGLMLRHNVEEDHEQLTQNR